MKKYLTLFISLLLLTGCVNVNISSNSNNDDSIDNSEDVTEYVPVKLFRGKVFETDIYIELNEEYAYDRITSQYDLYAPNGGCTSVGKNIKGVGTIIGRNMDLFVTDKPSFIVKTDVPGFKRTFGLTYTPSRGENTEAVLDHGVDKPYYDMIPFLQTDVLNEDGFYIEINMRYADYDASGQSIYSCSGTLPGQGKTRLVSFLLPYYLASRCSTVDEAVKMAKEELDIYTPDPNSGMDWNFCFMLADATGKYGVLEIAKNKIVWNEAIETSKNEMPNGACHANYYITPEFNKDEKMKSGVGRVDYLKEAWPSIDDENDMYNAINGVSYFSKYFDYCLFDSRTDYLGYNQEDGEYFIGNNTPDIVDGEIVVWDYDYVMNPNNQKYVIGYIDLIKQKVQQRIVEGTLEDIAQYWESTFTVVVNPANKRMFIRFNEDPKNVMTFDFNDWK